MRQQQNSLQTYPAKNTYANDIAEVLQELEPLDMEEHKLYLLTNWIKDANTMELQNKQYKIKYKAYFEQYTSSVNT